MNYGGLIISDIESLLELFSRHCAEKETLTELLAVLHKAKHWNTAHELFQRIRRRNLLAQKSGDHVATAQCCFEEICAKTLYNLGRNSAPFDPDSPYWIVPNALVLGRAIGIPDAEILNSITLD